eukprot:6192045-Alexandrium_andersonii.AAC.1
MCIRDRTCSLCDCRSPSSFLLASAACLREVWATSRALRATRNAARTVCGTATATAAAGAGAGAAS